jgi:hypothetical protein
MRKSFHTPLFWVGLILALLGGAAIGPRAGQAQFIDRIVRPCSAGIVTLASVIVNPNNTGNIAATTCTGGSFTINGTPVIPGGVTCTGCTVGTIPYFSAANTLANSPITRSSASAVRVTTLGLGAPGVTTGSLQLFNNPSVFTTTIQAGNAVASRTYTWPTNFGAAGTVLTDSAGNGTLSWAIGGTIGGSGTLNTIAKFTPDGTHVGNSRITDDGSTISATSADYQISTTATGAANIGDLVTNKALINVNAGSSAVNLTAGTAISIDSGAGTTTIGDVNGAGNGTILTLNDSISTTSINGNTAINIRTGGLLTADEGNGFGLIVDGTNNLTTLGKFGNNIYIRFDNSGQTAALQADGGISFNSITAITFTGSPVTPLTAGGISLGSNALPFSSQFIGAAATNNIQLTGTATGARVATLPDQTGTVGILLTNSATLDFGNVATIGCEDLTITVTGAALSDTVSLGVPNASIVANSNYTAWVSSANTVTVRFCALVSGNPASGTFKVDVWKH